MSNTSRKPIFCATHPRACSTAFERVFMTRRDILRCVHEPFGDAFYFGPERLSERYEKDEKAREESSFSQSTFKTILENIERENAEGKRIFIKDITHYLVPPKGKPASIAPSLVNYKRGVGTDNFTSGTATPTSTYGDGATNGATTNGSTSYHPVKSNGVPHSQNISNGTSPSDSPKMAPAVQPPVASEGNASSAFQTFTEPGNPTVVPLDLLKQFHFTFLIRHPMYSIPSYYRCTIPPLDEVTGFYNFMPSEAGYDELRRVFDYLKSVGHVGPNVTGQSSGTNTPREGGAVKDVPINGNGASNGINGVIDGESIDICVIDADDLLDDPSGMIKAFCENTGIEYNDDMLKWDNDEEHEIAKAAFEKWKGFHEDAIYSTELKPRAQKKTPKPEKEMYAEWVSKYGEEGAKVIKQTVDENVHHYEHLKQFAVKSSELNLPN